MKAVPIFVIFFFTLFLPESSFANDTPSSSAIRIDDEESLVILSDERSSDGQPATSVIESESETSLPVERIISDDPLPISTDQGPVDGEEKISTDDPLPISTDQGPVDFLGPIISPLRLIQEMIQPSSDPQEIEGWNRESGETASSSQNIEQSKTPTLLIDIISYTFFNLFGGLFN